MKIRFAGLVLITGLSAIAFAQAPATAPAGSTGMCNDGTYTSSKSQTGACSGHQGVKQWFGQPTASVPEKAGTPATASNVAPPATQQATPATTTSKPKTTTIASADGGAGQVWLNENKGSKTYHCPGTKYYGKTKHGEYMSEADAKAKGAHAAHGKACS